MKRFFIQLLWSDRVTSLFCLSKPLASNPTRVVMAGINKGCCP